MAVTPPPPPVPTAPGLLPGIDARDRGRRDPPPTARAWTRFRLSGSRPWPPSAASTGNADPRVCMRHRGSNAHFVPETVRRCLIRLSSTTALSCAGRHTSRWRRTGPDRRGGERPQGHRCPVRARGPRAFSHARPHPLLRSLPLESSLAGRHRQRRFEAAEDPFADRLADEPFGIAEQDPDEPSRGRRGLPARDCWNGRDPAAEGRMGLSGSIFPDAD